jgi:hypothetical protein
MSGILPCFNKIGRTKCEFILLTLGTVCSSYGPPLKISATFAFISLWLPCFLPSFIRAGNVEACIAQCWVSMSVCACVCVHYPPFASRVNHMPFCSPLHKMDDFFARIRAFRHVHLCLTLTPRLVPSRH